MLGVPIQFAITSSTNDTNNELHSISTIKFHFGLSTSNINCKTFQIHSINRVFLNFYAPAANRKLNYVRINLFINRLFSGFLDCQFVFRSNTLRAITIFGQFLCSQICILGRSQPSSSRCCRWGIID